MRAILASLLLVSSAAAQITGPSAVKQGERIVLKVELPEGARVAWLAESGADVAKFNRDHAHGWGTAGRTNTYQAVIVPADENAEPVVWSHVVTVDGTPVPPGPTTTLKQLAGDKAQALGTMYADLKTALTPALIDSVALFRTVHKDRLTTLGLAGNGAAAEIDRRLNVVLVEPWDAVKVGSVLAEFIAELGSLPPPITTTATAATYVYEKDETAVPSAVQVGLNRLNREKKIIATLFEDDETDGDGDVPDQYKVPLEAARKAGMPSLVVTNGELVLRVVSAPTTEAAVMEAVQ